MTPNIKALIKARQRAFTEDQQSLSSLDHADLMAIADRLQRSFIKPWLEIQPDPPRLQAVEHLLKDSHPLLPSIGQVKTVLKHLNPGKATGSDNIPAWCLKRYAEELATVVHDIVVASIVQCKYPTSYKHAIISPIPKIRPPTDLDSDFRQVSVLPQLAKVIKKLQLQLNKSSFKIKTNQHAFTSGHSTVSALTSISHNWFDSTDNSSTGRQGVHALFVDFRKAFDLVDHKILLEKIADINVTRSFWLWIMSFLEGRTQQVKLQGVLSFTA
jgi:hypothetical protein